MKKIHEQAAFLKEQTGATMIEYAFMVGLIAIVVAIAVGPFGRATANLFTAAVAVL